MKRVKNSLRKIQYHIDNAFSRGTPILIFWLGVISLFIMVTASIIIVILKISIDSSGTPVIFEVFWHSIISMISPGEIQENQNWVYRVIMLFVTLGGIFITSTLIGLISSSINQKLESLQRGRSTVFEEDHIVILGSNDQVFTIIHELIDAYQNSAKRKCIVLMGEFDKIEMDNKIHEIFPRMNKVRIVIRTGNPVDPYALDILNLKKAKAIIILSPDIDDPDSEVIKTCLAILKNHKASADTFHIIAEIRNSENKDVVKVFEENGIDWILSGEIISKITAQTCRQSGLSIIYTDLLDFAGDEIRLFSCKDLVGNSFGNVINLFEINSVIGLVPAGQKPILNPPMHTRIAEGDQLLLLAENQDKIFLNSSRKTFDEGLIESYKVEEIEEPEIFMFLGWNWKLPIIIKELDNYVPKHSRVDIFYDQSLCNDKYYLSEKPFENLEISLREGEISRRSFLDTIKFEDYDHVIILCYSDCLSPQEADAHSLITLLHVRDISMNRNDCCFSITSEMMNTKDKTLAEVTKPDDFIVSSKIISLLFSQIAEQQDLYDVFIDILSSTGSEIYLKPASRYIKLNVKTNFYTITESAIRKGEIAIGYRKNNEHYCAETNFGIYLNPNKSEFVELDEDDKIIVISED